MDLFLLERTELILTGDQKYERRVMDNNVEWWIYNKEDGEYDGSLRLATTEEKEMLEENYKNNLKSFSPHMRGSGLRAQEAHGL